MRGNKRNGLCSNRLDSLVSMIVPTFKENGIFMLRVLFSLGQFSAIEIIVLNTNKTARIPGQSPECSDCTLIHIA